MTDMPPPLVNITKAAKLLGVDRKTVYRWLLSGDLRATKMGGRTWIAGAEIERVLRTRGDEK